MNTYQMKYFLTTVECLNMTEAAEKLNMTQSALSRSISSMESELGVQLFIRDKRKKTRLTAEGAEIYNHLVHIYRDYETMVAEVEKLKNGITGKLVVGFLEGQMVESHFKDVLDLFTEHYPDIELELTRDTEKGLIQRLYDGDLDVAVLLELMVSGRQDIIFSDLFWLPTYMIASRNHPLAGRKEVSLEELKDDTFVYIEKSEVTNEMVNLCRKAGFEPKMKYVKNMREQSLYLEMGKGIAGYNEFHSCYYSPNVSTFRVPEIPDAKFVMAWNKNNFNPAVAMLNKLTSE